MIKHTQIRTEKQAKSYQLQEQLLAFLDGFLGLLNRKMDRRLVSTFFGLLMAILCHRHRNQGLVLSELGAFLLGPERCRAGTKRISNLLHSGKWQAKLIVKFLWRQGSRRVAELQKEGNGRWSCGTRVSLKSQKAWQLNAYVRCVPAKQCG